MRVRFHPFKNPAGTMLGWLTIECDSGLVIHDAKLMIGPAGKRWVSPPSVPRVHADGSPHLDERGKPIWHQIVEFQTKQARERFQEQVLRELRGSHPGLFGSAPK